MPQEGMMGGYGWFWVRRQGRSGNEGKNVTSSVYSFFF